MKKTKFKWWLFGIPILLAVAILAAVFWDTVLIRVAPKAVLTSAVSKVFSQLEIRFQDNPMLIVLNTVDPEGKYTADVKLTTENDLLGPVTYDMNIQTDAFNHQIFAEGVAATSSKDLDLSLYLDADFMAVSSEDLVSGSYYGITYDTFEKDLRSVPLLNLVISSKLLSQWNESVQNIQAFMSTDRSVPDMPQLSEGELQAFTLGLLALPCEIAKESVSVNGELLDCYAITYTASGEKVDELLAETPYAKNAAITVTFYLHEKSLVMVYFDCTADAHSILCRLTLGKNPAEEELTLQCIQYDDGNDQEFVISVSMDAHSEDHYAETWRYTSTGKTKEPFTMSYVWTSSCGAMELTANGISEPVPLNLMKTENGFRLQTDEFAKLIRVLKQEDQSKTAKEITCDMTVSRGASIETPAYKNLDQWSLEDFWELLSGVGSLFGINLG